MKIIAPPRGCDAHGCGHWQAPRGHRKHNGFDLAAYPKSKVLSPVEGLVSKIGYPYDPNGEKGHLRYVQITTADMLDFRFFYVSPSCEVGTRVKKEMPIGEVQDLTAIWPAMINHIHLEIKTADGEYVNPELFLELE